MVEESEPDEFWNSIGGRGDYSKCSGHLDKPILEPRLFHGMIVGDKMVATEVHSFEKDVSRGFEALSFSAKPRRISDRHFCDRHV